MSFVLFLDTETSGKPKKYNAPISDTDNWTRLVQLGWIVTYEDGLSAGSGEAIIRPNGFVIAQEATNVHGISQEMALVLGNGDVLGLVSTADAPVFGTDVAVQKARGALLFSRPDAFALISGLAPAVYAVPAGTTSSLAAYAGAFRDFVGPGGELDGRTAWSTRAIGNLHRPTYPDGLAGTPPGPLSKGFDTWSPFNVGFQLDLIYNQLVRGALGDTSTGCAGRAPAGAPAGTPDQGLPLARNGVQIFSKRDERVPEPRKLLLVRPALYARIIYHHTDPRTKCKRKNELSRKSFEGLLWRVPRKEKPMPGALAAGGHARGWIPPPHCLNHRTAAQLCGRICVSLHGSDDSASPPPGETRAEARTRLPPEGGAPTTPPGRSPGFTRKFRMRFSGVPSPVV